MKIMARQSNVILSEKFILLMIALNVFFKLELFDFYYFIVVLRAMVFALVSQRF